MNVRQAFVGSPVTIFGFIPQGNGEAPPTPSIVPEATAGGHGGKKRKKEFEYDRPYLSEWAELLRNHVQNRKIKQAEEVAEQIVEAIEPSQAPQLVPLIDVAVRLQDISHLEQKIRLNLARTLVLKAKAAERALQIDDEEAELLLMS